MKANILKAMLAVVALIIGATACDDKGYWEPYNPEGIQYSFVNETLDQEFPMNVPAAERIYTIPVRRSTSVGEATLALTLGSNGNASYKPSDMFEAPDTVVFADGESTAEVIVTFKGTRRNYDYSCKLSFEDQVSPGGFNSVILIGTLVNAR